MTQYNDTLRGDARRFELITLPYQDFAGMNASLGLLLSLGIQRVSQHLRTCMSRCSPGPPARVPGWRRLRGRGLGNSVRGPCRRGPGLPRLERRALVSSMREGAIRLSPHAYNTLDEMERVVEALEESQA